jgi:hypothetical protein
VHVKRLLDANRSVVLQPYLDRVDADGETALIYFGGTFQPRHPQGTAAAPRRGPDRELFARRRDHCPRVPKLDELRTGERALGAIPFATPLYARVDLIRDSRCGAACPRTRAHRAVALFRVRAGSVERFAALVLDYPVNGGA